MGFAKLDPESKAKLRKLTSDVVVRAANVDPDDMAAGVTGPLGFFDPLELATDENLAAFRGIELKHGRVCMLASFGYNCERGLSPDLRCVGRRRICFGRRKSLLSNSRWQFLARVFHSDPLN